jgi:DNA-binding transcriptional ArsR family regulator
VITLAVDAGRLVRSRFALSRLAELTNGLEVLARPERAPHARRWVEATRRRLDRPDVAVLFALVADATWYVPDFVVPVAGEYEPTLERELAGVAAMPAALVRYQLRMAFRIGPPPPDALRRSGAAPGTDPRAPLPAAVADVLAGGEAALTACVAEQLWRCWHSVMADSWPTVHRVLDEDVRHRAALAGRVGFGEIVAELHPGLHWDGARITLRLPYDVHVGAAPGLVLTPSVFLPRPAVWLGAPGQVMVGYPARGRGRVWAAPERPSDGAALLGSRRAALLADLDTPRSTTELAARHRLSPATVSYHLGRLLSAGLVARRQAGHSVLYAGTDRAVALLAAVDASPARSPLA